MAAGPGRMYAAQGGSLSDWHDTAEGGACQEGGEGYFFPAPRPAGTENEKRAARFYRAARVVSGETQASWALDSSTSWVKAALSLTAISASILRLISTPALFRPFMKVE